MNFGGGESRPDGYSKNLNGDRQSLQPFKTLGRKHRLACICIYCIPRRAVSIEEDCRTYWSAAQILNGENEIYCSRIGCNYGFQHGCLLLYGDKMK